MHRKAVYRWIAALALAAALGVMGAQPATAAELSDLGGGDRLANFWSAVITGPMVLWETLSGWLGAAEKSTTEDPAHQPVVGGGWISDPNGGEGEGEGE